MGIVIDEQARPSAGSGVGDCTGAIKIRAPKLHIYLLSTRSGIKGKVLKPTNAPYAMLTD